MAAAGGRLIAHNFIYRNTDAGILVKSGPGVRILNNSMYAPQGDNVRIQDGSSAEVRNNILWAESGYDLFVADDSVTGLVSDYNDLYAGLLPGI